MFNTILEEAGLNPADVRLLRHKDKRAEPGRTPYDLWRRNRQQFESYQRTQSFHNEPRLDAPFWASFVGTPEGGTLFVGVYSVANRRLLERDTPMPHRDGMDRAGSCHEYDLTLQAELGDLVGALLIDWGGAYRTWIQRADRQNKHVTRL